MLKKEPRWHGDTMRHSGNFMPISDFENEIGSAITKSALDIHRKFGPGLLEKVYEVCLCQALDLKGFNVERQIAVPITLNNTIFDEGLRIDILVEDLVIIELKAQENYNAVWEAQLLSYLKLTEKRLGYLINFHVPLIKQGIKRMII